MSLEEFKTRYLQAFSALKKERLDLELKVHEFQNYIQNGASYVTLTRKVQERAENALLQARAILQQTLRLQIHDLTTQKQAMTELIEIQNTRLRVYEASTNFSSAESDFYSEFTKKLSLQNQFKSAIRENNVAVVKELLSSVDPAIDNNAAIQIACRSGFYDLVKLLLKDARVDPTVSENDPLMAAVRYNHAKIVQLLLTTSRTNPAARNNLAIVIACSNGNVTIVKLLMADFRVNPAANSNEALREAVQKQFIDVIFILIKNPHVKALLPLPDPNAGQYTLPRLLYDLEILPAEKNHSRKKSRV